jgi:hypothetical protein
VPSPKVEPKAMVKVLVWLDMWCCDTLVLLVIDAIHPAVLRNSLNKHCLTTMRSCMGRMRRHLEQ